MLIAWAPIAAKWLTVALVLLIVAPAAAQTKLRSYAVVRDDGTLLVRGQVVRLFGIYVPPGERGCLTVLRPVRCGSRAAQALEVKIQGFVECRPKVRFRDRSIGAVCYADGGSALQPPVDLGAFLIDEGLAVAGPGAPFAYRVREDIARSRRRGVWGFFADDIR